MAAIRLLELRNTYKWGGGPDKTILLSAARHNPEQVETIVVYIRDVRDREFSIADKARALGLTFYEITEDGKLDLRVLRALRDIVIRHDINLIHGHDYKSDLFAYLLRRWLGHRSLAVLSTMHGWALLGPRGQLYWWLELFLLRRFNHIIAVSQATKDEMVAAGLPSHLVTVLHNAIDTETWAPAPASSILREELGLGQAFPVLGYVGRITPEKDLQSWLRVAHLVAQRCPQAHFVIVGEGRDAALLEQLKKLAVELGIAARVHFPGYMDNPRSAYALCDIFLLSSLREGICNSLLEAMAMGLPIVSTDAGGTRELVVDGQTGFLLPTQDVQSMAHAVLKLVDDASLRQHMGQASRQRVEQEFSFTSRLQRIEALYARVVGVGRVSEDHRGAPLL